MELHQKLARLRKQHRLNQETLADILGVSRQTISKWESGAAHPSKRNLRRLSQVYGTTTEDLLQETETPPEPELQETQKIPEPPKASEQPAEPEVPELSAPAVPETLLPAEQERETPLKKFLWIPAAAAILIVVGIAISALAFGGGKKNNTANQDSVPMDQIESEAIINPVGSVSLLPLD